MLYALFRATLPFRWIGSVCLFSTSILSKNAYSLMIRFNFGDDFYFPYIYVTAILTSKNFGSHFERRPLLRISRNLTKTLHEIYIVSAYSPSRRTWAKGEARLRPRRRAPPSPVVLLEGLSAYGTGILTSKEHFFSHFSVQIMTESVNFCSFQDILVAILKGAFYLKSQEI